MSFLSAAEQAPDATESTNKNTPIVEGFECADEFLPSIHTLGRGTDFPQFLIDDIQRELNRQTPGTQLLSVSCIKEPTVEGKAREFPSENGPQQVITDISATFHLLVKFAAGFNIKTKINHGYEVTDFHTAQPKVTQKFELL